MFDFLRTDYAKDALTMSKEDVLYKLIGSMGCLNFFGRDQLLRLFGDPEYLVLEEKKARKFVAACALYNHRFADNAFDCDDFEAVFRANRAKYRRKMGLDVPEAMGAMDYFSLSRGTVVHGVRTNNYHRAAWVMWHKEGLIRTVVYQPDADKIQEPSFEAQSVVYYDA